VTIFARSRQCDPPRRATSNWRCWIFQWVGQSFESCDHCDRPEQEHLYHPPYGGARQLFHVKQWDRFRRVWEWQPVGGFVVRRDA